MRGRRDVKLGDGLSHPQGLQFHNRSKKADHILCQIQEEEIGAASSKKLIYILLKITKISTCELNNIVTDLDVSISPFFTTQELEQLAKEAGFVQRKSKLDGTLFLDLIVFNSENLKDQSLNDLSVLLKEEHGIAITKQSLHERFNQSAVLFLKDALEHLLRKQLDVESYLLDIQGIHRILIKDSVCFQIDESLQEDYPGSGGDGSKAAVRIQFEYDLLCGKINDISLNAFNEQDATNSLATVDLLRPGDLVIRDLAYVGLQALKKMISQSAFFLCRLGTNVKVYECKGDDFVEIQFSKVRREMERRCLNMIEKVVCIGQKEKLKTRLVIHRLPAEEVEKRIRKARNNNKKKGRNELSKEYLSRAHLNLFITNTSTEIVPAKNVWSLYRLRWQIELTFKIWKSICDIEKVKKVNKHRLECYIYSKLILIMLGWKVVWKTAKNLFTREGKALSFYKSFKTLINVKLSELRNVFLVGNGRIDMLISDFYHISRTNHLLEKKNGSPSSLELLLSCSTD
jgi:hypothetical protein